MSKWLTLSVLAVTGFAAALSAAEAPKAPSPPTGPDYQPCRIDLKGDKKEQYLRLPTPESSITQHHVTLRGKSIEYTATAGTLIIRDDEDKPTAGIGYVAYVASAGKGGGARPITFAFNGGPGSSSLWLHMGVLGPKRVVIKIACCREA